MDENFENDILRLEDEDGTEHEFKVIDAVEHNGNTYYAVVVTAEDDIDDDEFDELLIMRVSNDSGEEFDILDEEEHEELHEMQSVFSERLSSTYDIEDGD